MTQTSDMPEPQRTEERYRPGASPQARSSPCTCACPAAPFPYATAIGGLRHWAILIVACRNNQQEGPRPTLFHRTLQAAEGLSTLPRDLPPMSRSGPAPCPVNWAAQFIGVGIGVSLSRPAPFPGIHWPRTVDPGEQRQPSGIDAARLSAHFAEAGKPCPTAEHSQRDVPRDRRAFPHLGSPTETIGSQIERHSIRSGREKRDTVRRSAMVPPPKPLHPASPNGDP